MRRFVATSLLVLSTACIPNAAAFLPREGRYIEQWDGEPERPFEVIGSGSLRSLMEGQRALGTLQATDLGIVDADGKVTLPSNLVVGNHWVIAGREGNACVVERRVVAVSCDRVEIERVGVCDGKPVEERMLSVWVVGLGLVSDSFTDRRGRVVTRVQKSDR